MRVALTMRVTQASGYVEPRDAISHDWIVRLAEWQMVPLLVPNALPDPAAYLDALAPDLLVLTGGEDTGVSPERDRTETLLLDAAITRGIPVLGVCRGLQLINACFGGHLVAVTGHVATEHALQVAGPWQPLIGSGPRVNSYHNFAIPAEGLGAGLEALATDECGNVEAVRAPGLSLAGIMWHPERHAARSEDRLFMTRLAAKDLP
ncbi:MAG: gamma-glutamyl-gamma-aminobutyrate hydrolase family protein [Rhodospirillaceae bacterium]|nr:gamma-glutamyl-gamma-aminobutyrate hydrolase family protein [Rhodospirillales bacterium]